MAARDRLLHVGLDREQDGTYEYVDLAQLDGPERAITVDGQKYEHVAEDANGVWLYRAAHI